MGNNYTKAFEGLSTADSAIVKFNRASNTVGATAQHDDSPVKLLAFT